jgi:hypothetical protein
VEEGGADIGLDRGPKRTNRDNEIGERIEDLVKAVVVRIDRWEKYHKMHPIYIYKKVKGKVFYVTGRGGPIGV